MKHLALLAGLALFAACTSVDIQKTALVSSSPPRITALAVAPMQDLSGNASASTAITAAIVNELRRRGIYRVVEIDNPSPGATERWTAAKLGTDAKVDAVLVGVVTAFSYDSVSHHGGPTVTPTIGLDLRLVAAKGAEILWAAGVEAQQTRLFSNDGMPLEQLAQKLAEQVADALASFGAKG